MASFKKNLAFMMAISLTMTLKAAPLSQTPVESQSTDSEIKVLWQKHKDLIEEKISYEVMLGKFKASNSVLSFIDKEKDTIKKIDVLKKKEQILKKQQEISVATIELQQQRASLMTEYRSLYNTLYSDKDSQNIFEKDYMNFVTNLKNSEECRCITLIETVNTNLEPGGEFRLNYADTSKLPSNRNLRVELYKSRLALVQRDPRFKNILPIYEQKKKIEELKENLDNFKVQANPLIEKYEKINDGILVGSVLGFVALAYLVALFFPVINAFMIGATAFYAAATVLQKLLIVFGLFVGPGVLLGVPAAIHAISGVDENLYRKLKTERYDKEFDYKKAQNELQEQLYSASKISQGIDEAVLSGNIKGALQLVRP